MFQLLGERSVPRLGILSLPTICAALVLVVASPGLLEAQRLPRPSPRPHSFADDSTQAVENVDALGQCEEKRIGSRTSGDLVFWRYGATDFSQLALNRARECLSRLVIEHPHDSWAWYGLGLVRLELSRLGAIARPGPLQPTGLDYARGAERAFERVLELDPNHRAAALLIPVALQRERYWDQHDEANAALRRTAGTPAGDDPAVLLARLRLERQQRERDSTLALARRYLANGGDPALGELELARELFARGDSAAAAAAYWRGAQHVKSDSARAAYRLNIAWVADSAELAAYDTLTVDSLAPWLHRFWARRDAQAARPAGARLVEHFRRLEYAGEHFVARWRRPHDAALPDVLTADPPAAASSIADSGGAGWGAAITDWLTGGSLLAHRAVRVLASAAPGDPWLDMRGPIYLRHGPPESRAGIWWYYRRGGRELILPVVPTQDRFPGDKCNFAMRYCTPLFSERRRLERLREELAMAEFAVSTDGYPRLFDKPLYPIVQLYALHQAPGLPGGRLLVVFGLRGARLKPAQVDSASGRAVYPLAMQVVATHPDGGSRIDFDTLRTFVTPAGLDDDEYLTGFVEVPLPAGAYDVRAVLEMPDSAFAAEYERPDGTRPVLEGRRGAVVALNGVRVPPHSSALEMSDVVLGRRGGGLVWWNGADSVALNPLNAFPEGGTVDAYYELSGLAPGTDYRTEISVRHRRSEPSADDDAQAEALVTLGFSERATAPRANIVRRLGLERLKRGSYDVEVVIRPLHARGSVEPIRRVSVLNVSKE